MSNDDAFAILKDFNDMTKESEKGSVDHPAHYNAGKIECIAYIEDQRLCFHLGNAVKYIARAGRKDSGKTVEDLEKAVWYIQRKIQLLSGGGQ